MSFDRIAVLGGGAWGTALANVSARAGREVVLWEHDAVNAAHLAKARESLFLPGVRLDDAIALAGNLAEAARADALLLVVPAQTVRRVATALAPLIGAGTPVIVCAKGIERGTRRFMNEIIAECAPSAAPAILSGPSFAADVARGMRVARRLRAGTVWVNTFDVSSLMTPFGGFKQSGHGRDRALHALDAYTQLTTTWIAL